MFKATLESNHLQPTQKDMERAQTWKSKSYRQKDAIVESIKDPNKALRRGVAVALESLFGKEYNDKFRKQAKTNGATEKQLQLFDETVKHIYTQKHEEFQAEQREKRKRIAAQVKPGLISPMDIRSTGRTRVIVGRKLGTLEVRFGQADFYYNQLVFRYHTKGGKPKTKILGQTHRMSYDLDYTQWLVNMINEYKIKPE